MIYALAVRYADATRAGAAGLARVLREPQAAFVTQWRAYLRDQLGR